MENWFAINRNDIIILRKDIITILLNKGRFSVNNILSYR